ncbi:hypothetical protein MMC28_007118 [Mycoblastus sanguinarius]|nr:hypothetical protein [Mycoblastus sanguinarius]
MTTNSQASLLLALPVELRIKIYEGLLSPDPTKVHTLYHDREGRGGPFNIDSSILRTNRQIYSEAVSVLYANNIFEISLTTPIVMMFDGSCCHGYHDTDPLALFRRDSSHLERAPKGLIYTHCFRHLRQIRLVSSRSAIWGWSENGSFFTHTGKLIVRILDILSETNPPSEGLAKSIELKINADWRTKYGIFQVGRTDAQDEKLRDIIAALGAARKGRTVSVKEKVFRTALGRLEEKEVDIERLVQFSTRT